MGLSCLRQGPDRLTPLPLCPCLFLTLSGARRWLVAQTHTGPCHHCGDPGVAMSLVHSRGALRGGPVRLQRGERPGPAAAEGREAADPEGVSLRNSSRPCAPVLAGPPPNPPCSPASRTHLRGPAPQPSHPTASYTPRTAFLPPGDEVPSQFPRSKSYSAFKTLLMLTPPCSPPDARSTCLATHHSWSPCQTRSHRESSL